MHSSGDAIIPDSRYLVQVFRNGPGAYSCRSSDLLVTTPQWGNVDGNQQRDVLDVAKAVDKLKDLQPPAITKAQAQLEPNAVDPQGPLLIVSVSNAVDALKGIAYPFSGPVPCSGP